MITEKRFVISHSAFWRHTAPMLPPYVRNANLNCESFGTPIVSTSADDRGAINEGAFRLCVRASEDGSSVSGLSRDAIAESLADAISFINRYREQSDEKVDGLSESGCNEALAVAAALAEYLGSKETDVSFLPRFKGCGLVDECSGDILCGGTLYEVKAGETHFRGKDFKQLLVYSALNFSSAQYQIRRVGLVNPRRKVVVSDTLENFCEKVGGVSASELLGEIIGYLTEGHWRDETV